MLSAILQGTSVKTPHATEQATRERGHTRVWMTKKTKSQVIPFLVCTQKSSGNTNRQDCHNPIDHKINKSLPNQDAAQHKNNEPFFLFLFVYQLPHRQR